MIIDYIDVELKELLKFSPLSLKKNKITPKSKLIITSKELSLAEIF
jgi:hypothetical protein